MNQPYTQDEVEQAVLDYCVRDLCLWSAVNMIANLVSKCEFRTYLKGKEVKGEEYYLWNVEPNQNQNSTAFLRKLISRLYIRNEALVIEVDGKLYVADEYQKTPYALYDHQFAGVTVDGYTFAKTFMMRDVLYFQLNDKNMRAVVDGVYESLNKLLKYAATQYQRARGSRGILKLPNMTSGNTAEKEALEDLMNNRFKRFFTANNAVLPLPQGYTYDDISGKTYSNETTRDVRAIIDDITDFTARGIGIPAAILRGTVEGTKDAMGLLLTMTVDPLADMLQEEINRKRNGKAGYLRGDYVQIDTKTIQHIDLLTVSTSIDKLIGSGAYCVNDIRKACGDSIIDESWAWQHVMTKNYAPNGELTNTMEGNKDEQAK